MAELFLDVVHVRAAPDEFGCAAPPERVRRNVLVELRPIGGGMDHVQKDLISKPPAPVNEKSPFAFVGQ